jgi:hypothetical protein
MYKEKFPKGSMVLIAGRPVLEHFQQAWKLHNPLVNEQLAFAGSNASIRQRGLLSRWRCALRT